MGLDEGTIEAFSFGRSQLNYFYDDNLIVCMKTTDEIKEKVVRKIAKNIHYSFVFKFLSFIKSNRIIDTEIFTSFKSKIFEILKYHRLLPKSKDNHV
jgi:hypothetical protein